MRIGFTGNWLDRADYVRSDPEAIAAAAADSRARLLPIDDGEPAVGDDGRLAWSSMAELRGDAEPIFLGFDVGGCGHFTQTLPKGQTVAGRSTALMRMLGNMPDEEAAVFGAARVLVDWHARNPFCSACGNATGIMRSGWGRACPSCATEHFPRVDPVVIMLAEHDGRALIGRGNGWPEGRYSALAGFVEPGESIEEAVAREICEEAGVRVRDVRYVASQPWPFPGQLMIACIGIADDPAITIDPKEIEDAKWVTRDEVRAALSGDPAAPFIAPPRYAIAHSLLTAWVG